MPGASAPIVSHGIGGAANINRDDTPYADGEIVREGPAGDQGDGAYSTGRGGAANIDASTKADPSRPHHPHDEDVIPETAIRPSTDNENYHTGRGGEGNLHNKETETKTHVGLADKLKHKMMGKKD